MPDTFIRLPWGPASQTHQRFPWQSKCKKHLQIAKPDRSDRVGPHNPGKQKLATRNWIEMTHVDSFLCPCSSDSMHWVTTKMTTKNSCEMHAMKTASTAWQKQEATCAMDGFICGPVHKQFHVTFGRGLFLVSRISYPSWTGPRSKFDSMTESDSWEIMIHQDSGGIRNFSKLGQVTS